MARTPIPPSATAARKRSTSERRSRCAMLTFSCFLPLETGTAGLVLIARTTQRYIIFACSAMPTEASSSPDPPTVSQPQHVVDVEHGEYTVDLWGASYTPVVALYTL